MILPALKVYERVIYEQASNILKLFSMNIYVVFKNHTVQNMLYLDY